MIGRGKWSAKTKSGAAGTALTADGRITSSRAAPPGRSAAPARGTRARQPEAAVAAVAPTWPRGRSSSRAGRGSSRRRLRCRSWLPRAAPGPCPWPIYRGGRCWPGLGPGARRSSGRGRVCSRRPPRRATAYFNGPCVFYYAIYSRVSLIAAWPSWPGPTEATPSGRATHWPTVAPARRAPLSLARAAALHGTRRLRRRGRGSSLH